MTNNAKLLIASAVALSVPVVAVAGVIIQGHTQTKKACAKIDAECDAELDRIRFARDHVIGLFNTGKYNHETVEANYAAMMEDFTFARQISDLEM